MSTIKIFISYASADREQAEAVCAFLEQQGKSCWIAPRNIPAGAEYGEEIIKGIENSNVLVLILSKASNASQHVLREVERAVNKKMPVIAYKIEECNLSKSMEYFLSANQWLDATADFQGMLPSLNQSVNQIDVYIAAAKGKKDAVAVSNKPVPILLGVIAVGLVAIVVVLAVTLGGNKDDSSKEDSVPETTTTTVTTEATTTTTDKATETTVQTTTTQPAKPVSVQAGEYLTFGSYFPTGYVEENKDSELKWQILNVDTTGKKLELITAQIIDIKPFDCAESGMFDVNMNGDHFDRTKERTYTEEELRQFRGCNIWAKSDLRTWLNATGNVTYSGFAENNRATDENGNAYGAQQGFLSAFTEQERKLLCDMTVDGSLTDKVTLLSDDEVNQFAETDWFRLYVGATKSAIASDTTSWYKTYQENGCSDYIWATRTPVPYNIYEIYYVQSSTGQDRFNMEYAAASGFGIRPVITISYDATKLTGEGNERAPYHFTD